MTTAVSAGPGPARTDVAATPHVPFGRLLHVELRKAVDTRSGRWLVGAVAFLTVAIVVVYLLTDDAGSLTYMNVAGVTALPQNLLLPVLGLLAATTEWTQRTALVTFTVEPSRIRVTLAKLLAVVAIGVLALVFGLVVAVLGNIAGSTLLDGPGTWAFGPADLRDLLLMQLLAVLQGFAFGMLLMNSAAALVAFFMLPTVWTIAFSLVSSLQGAAPWVDLGTATDPLYTTDVVRADDWAHIAVAGTLWVLLPLVLGTLRLVRREVKSG